MTLPARPRVGIRLPPCDSPLALAAAARRAEIAGFDSVWMPDSQLLWRDVFSTLAVTATQTERVQLGTAVTNLRTRHPTVIASAVRTLQDLAPGRIVLGVGAGNSALASVDMRPSSRAELVDGLRMIRTLLAGEQWQFDHGGVSMRGSAGLVPIYLAANGPKNLGFAGAIADGAILLAGVSIPAVSRAIGLVAGGARTAGRSIAEIDIVVTTFCHETNDVERDARLLKPVCAAIAQTGGAPLLRQSGIEVDVPDQVPAIYPDLIHAEDWNRAIQLCDEWISDAAAIRFADEYCLFGTADQIVARMQAAAAAGINGFILQHVGSYDLPDRLLEIVGRDVLPRLSC